jgi:hypothetical protein
MLCSFVFLPPSGIILHLTDDGSISILRHAFMSVHNVAGITFLGAALLHILYNVKAIKQYIVLKTSSLPSLKREAIAAFIISVGLILLVASHAFHVH